MKRDHKASKSKMKWFEKWFEDKAAMQRGLANHTMALDTDGKGVCNEAIEELLLEANATTADIRSYKAKWGDAGAFVTKQKSKSPLAFYIQQARVEAVYRRTHKRPDLQRQLSTSSSEPDSVVGASSSSAPDPAFGFGSSDIEDGDKWDNASEQAAFAERLKQGEKPSSSGPPSLGPAPYMPNDECFYGATPTQMKAEPEKFAPRWTNANPDKPKAQFLAKNTASGAWAEVTGW
jgi:hypothetical protein